MSTLLIGAGATAGGHVGSRTPRSTSARFHTLVTHAIFGPGLYAAGWVTSLLGTVQWRSLY